ncbi:MraY family glycosyltransferase [Caldifermentibacillus hisashii]|uniref:glycosyltransferase family 4 protein n=1 Tax=Caldifermentibacillus hisashii TaxID=996558 RepID=UPI0031FD75CD
MFVLYDTKLLYILINAFGISFVTTYLLVFPIIKLAIRFKIMDIPNQRKVNKVPIPRMGGLGIVIGTTLGLIYLQPFHEHFGKIAIGAIIVVITGLLDDKFSLPPLIKLIGQLVPACILFISGINIERVSFPFFGIVELSLPLSIIITFIWILGITNAINLIDGLDGLASGVSTIALCSILAMAFLDGHLFVIFLCVALIGSNLGFLIHNFHPAKIYMGDTGSLFLGYSIAVISILGLFKKVTLLGFIIPVIVLALPIFDTLFAIIRRARNGEKIMKPDKKHIHHQLLSVGLSHRQTVFVMYGISLIFGILAIVFSRASMGILLFIALIVCIMIYFLAEIVGLVGQGRKPVINSFKKWFFVTKGDNPTK